VRLSILFHSFTALRTTQYEVEATMEFVYWFMSRQSVTGRPTVLLNRLFITVYPHVCMPLTLVLDNGFMSCENDVKIPEDLWRIILV